MLVQDLAEEAAKELTTPPGGGGAAEDIGALLFPDQPDSEEMMGAISEGGLDEDGLGDEELDKISTRSDETDPCTEADDSIEDTPRRSAASVARTRAPRAQPISQSASPLIPPPRSHSHHSLSNHVTYNKAI